MPKHYNVGPVKPDCTFDGCTEPQYGHGLCMGHNQQRRRGKKQLMPLRKRGPISMCAVCSDPVPANVRTSGEPLCRRHHAIWQRHGDARTVTRNDVRALGMAAIREALSHRDRSDCWTDWNSLPCWNGVTTGGGTVTRGYPTIGTDRVMRLVLVESGRPVPPAPGNHGLHSCDNTLCWNPGHLRWGTHRQNMADLQAVRNYCKHCAHCNP